MTVESMRSSRSRRGALDVHQALRDDILWLRLEPGSALDEVALADRFNVSRTPIREALLLLASQGLVKFQPNRTSIVAPFSLDNASQYFDTLLILSRAMARAAAASGKADPDTLTVRIDAHREALAREDFESTLQAEHAFLLHLSSLANNIFQDRLFGEILLAGVRTRVLHYFPNVTPGELHQAGQRMVDLGAAICTGDLDRSDACIVRMIDAEVDVIMRSVQPSLGRTMTVDIKRRSGLCQFD